MKYVGTQTRYGVTEKVYDDHNSSGKNFEKVNNSSR